MVCFGPGAVVSDIQTSATKHEASFPGSYHSEKLEASGEEPDETKTCAVCLCRPMGKMYTTPCGHAYCVGCFANQCSSINADTIPIHCLGVDGDCQRIFEMPELRTALGDEAYETLLRRALAAHVATRPGTFRYCPAPDCLNIYRVSTEGEVISCSNCQLLVCTTCHTEHHDGWTCDENNDRLEGNSKAFLEWKATNMAKDCPRCGSSIQKVEGCNHVRCVSCRGHMCWVCLKVCKSSQATYAHMLAEHGSYVDEGDDAMREFGQNAVFEMPPLPPGLMEMPPLPPGLRGLQRIEQLQDHGGLVDLYDAGLEIDFEEMNEPDFHAPFGEQDMLRIRFAWALRFHGPAGYIRLPARGRERPVGEHGPFLVPLQPAELANMLRQRRDKDIFRHLEQLDPRDVTPQLKKLGKAAQRLEWRRREVSYRDLLDQHPDMVDPYAYLMNENADFARVEGGLHFVHRLLRRFEGRIPGAPMAAPRMAEVLLLLQWGMEERILTYAGYLALAAPLELENLFQALDEAIDIVAREEEPEAMDVPADILRDPAHNYRIDPEDAAENQLIQRIARRVLERMPMFEGLRNPAEKLQILRLDRMELINQNPELVDDDAAVVPYGAQFMAPLDEVPTAGEVRLFRNLQRRVEGGFSLKVIQPVEILVLLRQNREDLAYEFIHSFDYRLQGQEVPERREMERNGEEAFEMRRREIFGDLAARREADAKIDELAAQLD